MTTLTAAFLTSLFLPIASSLSLSLADSPALDAPCPTPPPPFTTPTPTPSSRSSSDSIRDTFSSTDASLAAFVSHHRNDALISQRISLRVKLTCSPARRSSRKVRLLALFSRFFLMLSPVGFAESSRR
ncbi:hypothetical protein R3P38DRAFT_3094657 [Favolaschia claudopus]|uniref:Secreted protein n=1 Tax=Favolaschia claudopus TaxID=2862362 RepID=A0AAV9ZQA0_9AGAR